jgi:hypothetical protein
MIKFFQLGVRNSLFLAAALISFAMQAPGQEGSRTLTGSITSGYSSQNIQGESSQGPYVGIDADFLGYWKDPRILQFEVTPNFSSGFQWTGPTSGPQTTGIGANGTLLDGSRFPLTVYFSRQSIPSPDISLSPTTLGGSTRFVSVGRRRQDWGLDWVFRGERRYPTFRVHYAKDASDDEFPTELGGTLQTRIRNFWVESDYRIAGWQLNGRLTDITNASQSQFFVDNNGRPIPQSTADRGYFASATHKLPLSSEFLVSADKHDTAYDLATGFSPRNNYSRFAVGVSTHPWSRLTLSASESYVTSFADFVRSQVLSTGILATPDSTAFLQTNTDVLTNAESANFTIARGLVANGSFNRTTGVSSQTNAAPETQSEAGGLSYNHLFLGGNATASYTYTVTSANFVNIGANTVGADSSTASDSSTHSVSLGYGHTLPLELKMNASANFALENSSAFAALNGHVAGGSLEISRHVSNWNLSVRSSYDQQFLESTTNTKSTNVSFGFSANSKAIQLNVVDSYTSGLAYIFGNTVVIAPVGVLNPGATGLPFSSYTSGNNFMANGSYHVSRRLFLRGMWSQGNRSISNASPTNFKAYNFGFDYRFRRVSLGAGYARTTQHLDSLNTPDFLNRQIYFQIRREFRLF